MKIAGGLRLTVAWLAGCQTGATVMGSILHRPLLLPIVATFVFNLMAVVICASLSLGMQRMRNLQPPPAN